MAVKPLDMFSLAGISILLLAHATENNEVAATNETVVIAIHENRTDFLNFHFIDDWLSKQYNTIDYDKIYKNTNSETTKKE